MAGLTLQIANCKVREVVIEVEFDAHKKLLGDWARDLKFCARDALPRRSNMADTAAEDDVTLPRGNVFIIVLLND